MSVESNSLGLPELLQAVGLQDQPTEFTQRFTLGWNCDVTLRIVEGADERRFYELEGTTWLMLGFAVKTIPRQRSNCLAG